MTNDLISQAEDLIEKHATSGYIHRDATLLLPGLVEEIKRLRVLECAAKANMTRRDEDIGDLMKELAKWQQIAIQQRALINFIETEERYAYSEHVVLSDDEISIAAKELGLQVTQEAGYLERLKEDFIFYARSYEYLRDPEKWKPHQERYEKAEQKAQAALEKIRRG